MHVKIGKCSLYRDLFFPYLKLYVLHLVFTLWCDIFWNGDRFIRQESVLGLIVGEGIGGGDGSLFKLLNEFESIG